MAPMTFLGSITTPPSWPTTLTMPLGSLPLMQIGKSANRALGTISGEDSKVPLCPALTAQPQESCLLVPYILGFEDESTPKIPNQTSVSRLVIPASISKVLPIETDILEVFVKHVQDFKYFSSLGFLLLSNLFHLSDVFQSNSKVGVPPLFGVKVKLLFPLTMETSESKNRNSCGCHSRSICVCVGGYITSPLHKYNM